MKPNGIINKVWEECHDWKWTTYAQVGEGKSQFIAVLSELPWEVYGQRLLGVPYIGWESKVKSLDITPVEQLVGVNLEELAPPKGKIRGAIMFSDFDQMVKGLKVLSKCGNCGQSNAGWAVEGINFETSNVFLSWWSTSVNNTIKLLALPEMMKTGSLWLEYGCSSRILGITLDPSGTIAKCWEDNSEPG